MLRKWYGQLDMKLRITPVDPILIKSGAADPKAPDMHPVAIVGHDGKKSYYLPGTSLKGVFRSHLERIGRTLAPAAVCIPYYDPTRCAPDTIPVEDQRTAFGCSYLLKDQTHKPTVYRLACPVCRLFGLLGFAGRIQISDALAAEGRKPKAEVRNGVGIDRFTGGAATGVLFDQEVLVGGAFDTTIRVTNFELWQVSALLHLLLDLRDGLLQIGSGRSRGLGRVTGEPLSMSITTLRRADGSNEVLRGLWDWENETARADYGFLDWRPEPAIGLGSGEPRGIRVTHDLLTQWESLAESLAMGMAAAFDAHAANRDVAALRSRMARPARAS